MGDHAGSDGKEHMKKYPCPDCDYCQWCSRDKCSLCRGAAYRKCRRQKKKGQKPLFRSY